MAIHPDAPHQSPLPHGADYRVELDAYAGPLDLLLFLVKRHEIDLNDIPIARLTEQYLKHLEVIRFLDMDQAGEFLVMAATLLEIKSQTLVPAEAGSDDGVGDGAADRADTGADPRLELVHQLLAYKRFKDAAITLEHRGEEWSRRFSIAAVRSGTQPAPAADPDSAPPADLDLEDVHILDLCEAFARVLESIGSRKLEHEVTYDDTPISLHAEDIYDRLMRDGRTTLEAIFEGRRTRSEMIGLFLATLELVRQRKIRVVQDDHNGQIALEPQPPEAPEASPAPALQGSALGDAAADWRDPHTGEMQYDWPDEAARRRFERRLRIRASRAAQGNLADVPMMSALEDEEDSEAFDAEDAASEDAQGHDPLDEETELDLLDDAA